MSQRIGRCSSGAWCVVVAGCILVGAVASAGQLPGLPSVSLPDGPRLFDTAEQP